VGRGSVNKQIVQVNNLRLDDQRGRSAFCNPGSLLAHWGSRLSLGPKADAENASCLKMLLLTLRKVESSMNSTAAQGVKVRVSRLSTMLEESRKKTL